jgi:nitronate monooxygenase
MTMGNPTLANTMRARLKIPVIGGPMFIASSAALVIAQCTNGIIGAIPALNARSTAVLDETLHEIEAGLAAHDQAHPTHKAAPYSVNLVAHHTNARLEADLAVMLAHKVPLAIVSLAAPRDIVGAVHDYGGLVFNDVISNRHAQKCAEAGVDGLIAVCAGAGGHTGNMSPFALVQELRDWWHGPLALSGCIATGQSIFGARAMGADFAYIGSLFLANLEAATNDDFKQMVARCDSRDVVVTDCFTGVPATFLRPSIEANGLDPNKLSRAEGAGISIADGGANAKAWRDIWSAGQGIGAVRHVEPTAMTITRLTNEYELARKNLSGEK